jgi:hypothetical protein
VVYGAVLGAALSRAGMRTSRRLPALAAS